MANHYAIQDVASRIHRDYHFSTDAEIDSLQAGLPPRICNCHRAPQEGSLKSQIGKVEVWRSTQKAHYRGLQTCGSVHACPVCAPKIASFRAEEIKTGSGRYLAESKENCLVMVTFTRPHYFGDDLLQLVNETMKARRLMRQQKPLKRRPKFIVWNDIMKAWASPGQVTAVEVPYSDRNGWHPHSHDLIFVGKNVSPEEIARTEKLIAQAWLYACKRAKIEIPNEADFLRYAVRVERMKTINDYLAKVPDMESDTVEAIKSRIDNRWGYADEIARANSKQSRNESGITPFDMLRLIEASDDEAIYKKYGRLYREYTRVMKGKRHIFWSKGLKERMGLVSISDQEIADSHDETEAELVMEIAMPLWNAILHYKLRAQLADYAMQWTREDLTNWVHGIYERWRHDTGDPGPANTALC